MKYIIEISSQEENRKIVWIDAESLKEAKTKIPPSCQFVKLVDIEPVHKEHSYFKFQFLCNKLMKVYSY